MKLPLLALLLVSPLALASPPDISKTNGGVRTEANREYRDLESVNGGITVAEGVIARKASTVNGGITIESGAQLESAETVNGGISLGARAAVSRDVETVNGGIRIESGGEVGGNVETVNGGIALKAATVNGDLSTYNGSITVGADSVVHGGITVKKPNKTGFNWGWGKQKPPRVTIGENAEVKGTLFFEREVELQIHPTAKVGPIKGETPIRIDGADAAVER